ncbi:stage III sporulation protein AF [[Clostridium] colinum]|uniref:stage III sporulation protein AF n=1 Tax=[Clostridium] colinum TaxID=36835 RepID=UPI002023F4AD|nr:stage III sporulation protein AF [[Clostridium] colinum]
MLDYFYDYIKNIILFLVFMSFIQVILPTNKYRSYINLVFGMILVFIMIEPLNLIFDSVKNVEALTIFNEQDFKQNNMINVEKYKNIQNDMVKSAFKENIKSQIKTILKDKYIIKDINLELYENKYEEINIESIYLTLVKNNQNIYIKPFNEDKNLQNAEKQEIDNIKNLISQVYNIKTDNVFITIA